MDRTSETIYLSFDYIKNERMKAVEFLQDIFTGFYLVEYRGSHSTKITQFNKEGMILHVYKYWDSLLMFGKKKIKLLFPVF